MPNLLERLRQEDWFQNRKQYLDYLEDFEAFIISKDMPNAINTPLKRHDPRLPIEDENFYKYGKRVLKTLKKIHAHLPNIFIEILSHLSIGNTKIITGNNNVGLSY